MPEFDSLVPFRGGFAPAVLALLLALTPQRAIAQANDRLSHVLDSLRTSAAPASGFAALTIPGAPGTTTMVLRIDEGRWIPPHIHNVPKVLRVVDGTLLVGHGERIDTTALRRVAAGDTATMAANHAHFEGAAGRVLVVLTATAPFTTTWVQARQPDASATPRPRSTR